MTLYQHANFGGVSEKFYDNDPDLRNNRIGNDEATSIQVDPGCTAILYRDINFGGKSLNVSSAVRELGKPIKNDEVSSIRVFCR